MRWTIKYRDFDGTVSETVDALSAIVSELDWAREGPEPSVRLLRHYAQEGALDRPERRGKEAFYGFRHLAQFLALRWLLKNDWPLKKAAVETSMRSNEELLDLIAEDGGERPVFASLGGATADAARSRRSGGKYDPVAERQSRLAARRARLNAALEPLRAQTPPEGARTMMNLELTPWCATLVDASRLASLTDAEADVLGEALAQALMDARADVAGAGKRRR